MLKRKNSIAYHTQAPRVPDLDAFERSYIRQALWTSNDAYNHPLDLNHDIMELPLETIQALKSDCVQFRSSAAVDELLKAAYELRRYGDEQAGGDFWLTRNDTAEAGFWDQNLGVIGESLTTMAYLMGPRSLIVDPEGKIIVSPEGKTIVGPRLTVTVPCKK